MIKKVVIVFILVLMAGLVIYFDIDQYLTLKAIQENKELFTNYFEKNPYLTSGVFFLVYVIVTALSIPGAAVLTLLAGSLFGLFIGTIIVSFASTIGATLAFLTARFLFQETIEKKYGRRLESINKGIEKEGAFYLFTLRLVPIFPFFLINLLMGLSKIKILTFFFVSQAGMFLGTIVYVNAGAQLSKLSSLSGILSPKIIISFIFLGLFPLIAKKIINYIKAKKVYKDYKKPSQFDYNIISIGAGSAGLVTSYIGATVKASVALIEKNKMGGDCLNTGCVPSKAIIKSSKIAHMIKQSEHFGIFSNSSQDLKIDFQKVMNRVHDVIKKIEPHDSIERYEKLGVDCITGKANIISPYEVEVNGKVLTTKNITIATGASPFIPPIKGIDKAFTLTSENLWDLKELPSKFVVLGGGPIGLEMAQCFNRLGSEVFVIERNSQIMSKEDEDVASFVSKKLTDEGVHILTDHEAIEFLSPTLLKCKGPNGDVEIEFSKVLVAVGRKANTKGFGLEKLGIELRENGTIKTNEYLQTKFPNIYACGDVTGPYQLTHMAAHQAWYCAVNALFGKFKKFKVDYSVVPWTTYTDPEVATVGKNEKQLKKEQLDYEIVKYNIDDLDRAIADSNDMGFVKVLLKKGSDKIYGVTIASASAGELIIEFVTTMKHGKGLNGILSTIHSYPTMSEANKYTAGEWKKAHAPEKLLKFVEKFHRFSIGK